MVHGSKNLSIFNKFLATCVKGAIYFYELGELNFTLSMFRAKKTVAHFNGAFPSRSRFSMRRNSLRINAERPSVGRWRHTAGCYIRLACRYSLSGDDGPIRPCTRFDGSADSRDLRERVPMMHSSQICYLIMW